KLNDFSILARAKHKPDDIDQQARTTHDQACIESKQRDCNQRQDDNPDEGQNDTEKPGIAHIFDSILPNRKASFDLLFLLNQLQIIIVELSDFSFHFLDVTIILSDQCTFLSDLAGLSICFD